MTKETDLQIPVSPGELLDKLTILQIKRERFTDPVKRGFVVYELQALNSVWTNSQLSNQTIEDVVVQLKQVNEQLWDIEDELRQLEADKEFSERFIYQARQVYITNDRRAALKLEINQLLGAKIVEHKQHPGY